MASLLHISDAASLALHTGALLAYYHPNRVTTHAVAEALSASEAHLSKVLQRLARHDIVRSIRGPHGGFTLNKAPQEITLLQVYEAIEGPLDSRICLQGTPVCEISHCIMGHILRDIYAEVHAYLSGHTLAHVAPLAESLPSLALPSNH